MGEVKRAYFKLGVGLSEDLYKVWKRTRKEVDQLADMIRNEYGADALFESYPGKISGFCLNGHGNPEKRGFTKVDRIFSGQKFTVYTPNRRFREGKRFSQLCRKHAKLVEESPDFNVFAAKKLKMERMLVGLRRGQNCLFRDSIGYVKECVVGSIPYDEKHPLPDNFELIQIKKSEYIALTEE